MKFTPVLSTALLLGSIALSSAVNTTKVSAALVQKPYFTAASNQGSAQWTWTFDSQEQACFTAFTTVLGSGQSVDRATWGTYKTNALNKAQLSCKQGNKEVLGTGGQFFENGENLRKSLNWSSCTVKIINNPPNQPEPNPELTPVCDKKPDLPQCN